MKKLLIIATIITTSFVYANEKKYKYKNYKYDKNSKQTKTYLGFDSASFDYKSKTENNGKYDKVKETDLSVSANRGNLKNGLISFTYTRRYNDRKDQSDIIVGLMNKEIANLLSVSFTKMLPSKVFFGGTAGYGTASNDISLDFNLLGSAATVNTEKDLINKLIDKDDTDFRKNYGSGGNDDYRSMLHQYLNADDNTKMTAVKTQIKSITAYNTDAKVEQVIKTLEKIKKLETIDASDETGIESGNETRRYVIQRGSTTGTSTFLSGYVGTKITKYGWDLIPIIGFNYESKTLSNVDLQKDNTERTDFYLDKYSETYGYLNFIVQKEFIKNSILNIGVSYVKSFGTDIRYQYKFNEDQVFTIDDSPKKTSGLAWNIGFTMLLFNKTSANLTYDHYKAGDDTRKQFFINFKYNF